MAERNEPFNQNGYCQACKRIAHERILDYNDLARFFKQKVSTLKTWNSLQNAWLTRAHATNRTFALNALKRTVNGRPAGGPMFLHVEYHGKRRIFRPLPPQIAPARYHGCVISAYFYDGVLLSGNYDPSEHIAALNQRKQIEGKVPPPTASPIADRGGR